MNKNKKIRVACSVRVSHEEQVKGGFSIQTQIDHLQKYLSNHPDLVLVDFYIDEGVSADKLKKRTELQRLLKDVQQDKIDLILFTKLDRWFRSVEKYYQVQNILDKHNVSWKAILEDYETETANGRFKVNIMLSVAQQEREKTSERIKDVFQYKVKNGEPLYGAHILPFGFTIKEVDGKKIVAHNKEEEPILNDLIEHYMTYKSKAKTVRYINDKYNLQLLYESVSKLLINPMLYGSYRNNDNYCEPYISKDKFDEMQFYIKKNIRERKTNYTYIFSGLIVCPICGKHLSGAPTYNPLKNGGTNVTLNYRCDNSRMARRVCSFRHQKSELKFEKEVINKLGPAIEKYIVDCESNKKSQSKKKIDIKKLEDELQRLNNLYIKGRLNETTYEKQYDDISRRIEEAASKNEPEKTLKRIKSLKDVNISDTYKSFSQEEKQVFINSIVKDIYIDEEYNVTDIIFL